MTAGDLTMNNYVVRPRARHLGTMLLGISIVIGAVVIGIAALNVDAYSKLIDEDGIIENASATLWLLAAIAGTLALFTQKRRLTASRIVLGLLLVFFVLCGGEEISWGQRILGFQGPQQLVALNKQHETNLHNIGSISVFSNVFFVLTLIFFLGLPWLAGQSNMRSKGWWQSLPKVSSDARRIYLIGFLVWVIIGIRFGTLGFHPYSLWGYYTQMDDEIFEFYTAYSFFAFSVLDLFCLPKSESDAQNSISL